MLIVNKIASVIGYKQWLNKVIKVANWKYANRQRTGQSINNIITVNYIMRKTLNCYSTAVIVQSWKSQQLKSKKKVEPKVTQRIVEPNQKPKVE